MFRKQANPFVRFGLSSLVIGIVLLALNIFNTARTVAEYPGIDFMDVFWVTEGTNGASNVRLMVQVWGPVILIPLGIILLIVAVVTRKGNQDAQQQAGGQSAAGQFGGQQAAPQYGAPQQSQQWQQQSQGAQASQWTPEQPQQAPQAPAQQYGAQAGYYPAQSTQGDAAAPQYGQQAPNFGDDQVTKQ